MESWEEVWERRSLMKKASIVAEPRRIFGRNKEHIIRGFVSNLAMACPGLIFGLYTLSHNVNWPTPSLIMPFILALGAGSFTLIAVLDSMHARTGQWTMPGLLSVTGIVMLFMIAEAANRFLGDFGYGWLLPVALSAQAVLYVAIFTERGLLLKTVLLLDSFAISVLWGLGASDRMFMPF